MKAVVINDYGRSDRLHLAEIERPKPGPGEVLIRVRAAAVNPVDWKLRSGMLRIFVRLKLPAILGGDVAGIVEELGPGASRFKVGDPVFAMLDMRRKHGPGGYAEFAPCAESACALKPDSLSFEEAAAIPIAGVTALQALRDLGRLEAGQSALINGAAGGVGSFAVQIAKALGAHVTGVCGPANVKRVQELGADVVVDYSKEDFTLQGETYHVIFDAVAKRSFGACEPILRPGGAYISTLPSPGLLFSSLLRPLSGLLRSGKHAHFVAVKPGGSDLEYLGRLCDEGKLRPVIARTYALEEVRQAHEQSETEHAAGKIVLRVG